jgi:hypothetical protein
MKTTIYSSYKWLNEASHICKVEIPVNKPVTEAKANEGQGFLFAVQGNRHEKT